MIVYVVYRKDYKLKQGQLVDVLVERRKDLRGQIPLESGLKWAKVALGSSLEKERSIFVVPKKLELGADPEILLGKRILSTEMPANFLPVHAGGPQALPSAGTLEIAHSRQNDLPLDGIRPQFMVPSSWMRFYGLSEKPFELVSDRDSFYMTSNYREVLGTVTANLKNRSGVIVIIGEPGVGKTTLVHYLLNRLDGEVETVFFPFGRVTFEELLRFLLQGLGLRDRRDKETDLLGQVNEYLSKKVAGDKNLALFIDEAQTFQEEVLGELERLLETSRPVQIVLIGQPELEEKLASPQLASLRQKISTQRKIRKLSHRESKEYINYRLKVVGSSISELFTPEAAAMIIAYARGIPRIINVVCDNALLKGYLLARRRVDKAIVKEVIRDRESLTYFRVGPTRFFGTLAGLRLELRSYLQMANSATQTMFERAL